MKQSHQRDLKFLRWSLAGARIFSTCGKRQHMAIIVDARGFVVGVGYNGVPSGFTHCIDGGCPRLNNASPPGSSYEDCLSNHAEQNALLNSFTRDARTGGTIYVTGEPCFTCAKLITNSGITRVVITQDPSYVYSGFEKVEELFARANIELVSIDWNEVAA